MNRYFFNFTRYRLSIKPNCPALWNTSAALGENMLYTVKFPKVTSEAFFRVSTSKAAVIWNSREGLKRVKHFESAYCFSI